MKNLEEILIDSIHSRQPAIDYMKSNLSNESILIEMFDIVEDDEKCDARLEGAYWISEFDTSILSKYEDRLIQLLSEELDSITAHIMVALGRIRSKEGMKSIIKSKITPELYWEGKALEEYFNESN